MWRTVSAFLSKLDGYSVKMLCYLNILLTFALLISTVNAAKYATNGILRPTNETASIYNETDLTHYIYTLQNSSDPTELEELNSDSNQVDCLGLGKTIASALEWFFRNKPNGSNALDVEFWLSSRIQPERVQVFTGKQFGLEWTDFQIRRRTVIIVHGFLSHGQETWIKQMEEAFLDWGDVNVIVVDWSSGGNTWNYYKAAVNTRVVGYQIARFLEQVGNATLNSGISSADDWGHLYLVGHSLGAHICGFTAKELKRRQSNWIVDRITGLDPAQPCFKTGDSTVKLHKSDAAFVDIIHTNGRLLSQIGFGLPEPIGHVDFYPNGGRSQPGCIIMNSMFFKFLPIPQKKIKQAVCSHGRSYVYLTESLGSAVTNNCTFWAHHWDLTYRNLIQIMNEPCTEENCTEMGIRAENHPQRGTFFVATANSVPFCINTTRATHEVKVQLETEHKDDLQD